MRVFICTFASFTAAIPTESVSSLMLYTRRVSHTVEYHPKNGNAYVSLPRLFKCPTAEVSHGITLKNNNNNDETMENKIILLTTKVEKEMEIKNELVYPLPKIFTLFRISTFFNGILFNSNNNEEPPLLFINTGQLALTIQKELAA